MTAPVQAQLIVNAPAPVTVQAPDTKELERSYAAEILPLAKYTIETPEQYVQGNLDWQKAKAFSARIDELFEQPVKLAHQAHKALTTLRASLKAPADQIAAHVGAELVRYRNEQERIRAEAEARERARIEEERQRQIAEAEAAAEAERQRLIAERQAALEATPEWEREEEPPPIPETVAVVLPPPPEPVRLPSTVPQVIGGPRMVDKPWECVIDDPVALLKWVLEKPEDRLIYVQWDTAKLNAKARELGADLGKVIPGARAHRGQTLKRS